MMGLFIDVDPTRKRSSERGAGLAAGVAEGDRIGGVPTADRTPLAWLRELIRDLADLVQYRRERAMYRETTDEVESLFKRFVFESEGRRCLCLAFEGDELPVPAQSWPTLSLDQVERRARAEGRVAIDLEDRYFDAVLCLGLGYVWRPSSLLAELRRVLKDSGQLWIQVPLSAPYSSIVAERRTEYWRMTPEGLRTLLTGFDEILCSVYSPDDSALRTASFYYGLKPPADGGELPIGSWLPVDARTEKSRSFE